MSLSPLVSFKSRFVTCLLNFPRTILLYMFRASSAHLQEDTVVYMQPMVVTLYESSWWPVGTQLMLYMFRASSAHLQEDTVVYMQHMVLSQFLVACRYTA